MRTRHRTIVAVAALTLLTAGCSSATDDASPSSTADASSAFPVTVTGALGSAEVTDRPERVVALSPTDADFVFALGVTPVAIDEGTSESGYQPWVEEHFGPDLPPLVRGVDGQISVEEIAALEPDLIVATKVFGLDRVYDQLSAIAPVVHYADNPSTESWQDATATVADALGVPDVGAEVVRTTETDITEAAQDYSALGRKTFTFFVGPVQDSVYVVNSDADAGARFLQQLGMAPTPFATSQPQSTIAGRALISYELLSQTDADVLIATGRPGTIDAFLADPGLRGLSAVERGAVVPLEPVPAQSIAFPSSLSLGWALTNIVPQLAAAAQR
ncbi:iron ABC transporter substrate-binding protein [Rhodococcoides trifolii]|uniref:Iron ABC transporter substrate-binding protein n=1 Tax=Rhodococcoides trifolii TaxID=908250 RepID=A0A917G7D5_9NOCA|nr:iron-siderophore ABC transporter substrate-binding protein [Rhodococcus trifolii]GGG25525.1 iron ABC transporter substrate-binding protein [Rhodococcus trifolii]